MITRLLPATLAASVLIAASIGSFADPAHADPVPGGPGCQTDPFGPLGSWRRTLCDSPTASDGSWSRERTIWVPAQWQSGSCPSSSHSFCSSGHSIPEHVVSNETYPVQPDTVLPDEPGHLG